MNNKMDERILQSKREITKSNLWMKFTYCYWGAVVLIVVISELTYTRDGGEWFPSWVDRLLMPLMSFSFGSIFYWLIWFSIDVIKWIKGKIKSEHE